MTNESAEKTRVLVVDDDPAIAESLKLFLNAKGFEVACAFDGDEALDAARKSLPDVMLLDVMLPKRGGFDVCKLLSAEPKTRGIRIIISTGLGRMSDVEAAFAAGARDYIVKPFDNVQLLKKIGAVLKS